MAWERSGIISAALLRSWSPYLVESWSCARAATGEHERFAEELGAVLRTVLEAGLGAEPRSDAEELCCGAE